MDFSVFFRPAFSGGGIYLDWVLSGIKWTLLVSILGWVIAFTTGSVLGVLRTTQLRVLRALATVYVEVFRNVPLLVQMFIWYFVLPEIVPKGVGDWMKTRMPMPEFWNAVLCLGFYTASRVAEQVRSGIQSIPAGQTEAGLAMGLTRAQVYRHVLLPMGYRIVIPPLTSEFLTIFKNSSVALTIGVLELTAQAQQISEYTFRTFEAFTVATLVYVLITLTVTVAMRALEKKIRVLGYIGSTGK
ncbi:MAG TPA: glutamate ABC transporter permease [Rhodocyclaceae bacterium]|nr:MAG: glutamate ABC transporter permease [Rhodocyclales bacterium CG17_big_fil_post_rev_8_21_14_2_50_68_7]PIX75460.1 MAG: glutamate ABC transporter permease [Rhodocyclales bacterium CG_4_10_14_3_um_filter_68_10]HCX33386.1 glutamate ABC transporter permease [Rhodocyclaceae bacterium]